MIHACDNYSLTRYVLMLLFYVILKSIFVGVNPRTVSVDPLVMYLNFQGIITLVNICITRVYVNILSPLVSDRLINKKVKLEN